VISGRSVGVPGNVRLAAQAHARHGNSRGAALFAPAIKLARDGWVLSARGREYLVQAKNRAAHQPEALALFYDAAGEPLPVGTTLRNPALAETLEQIANNGPEWFYSGANAQAIATEVAAETLRAGAMTAADLGAYQARERPELCGAYRGYRICGWARPRRARPPCTRSSSSSSGSTSACSARTSPTFWHLFAESQRLAYADRERWLADADFVSVPATALMDERYLAGRSALIDPAHSLASVAAGTPPGLAVVPADGDEPSRTAPRTSSRSTARAMRSATPRPSKARTVRGSWSAATISTTS
jgi:gamma-glutamyltranspeptidase/glutathione hydrolase